MSRARALILVIAASWVALAGCSEPKDRRTRGDGLGDRDVPERTAATLGGTDSPIDREFASAFSTIRVRDEGRIRSMLFVRDDGTEATETSIDLDQPARLVLPYTRSMFANYLYQSKPRRALIVGLGGGAMVHFLRWYDPELAIEVVEIDPVVIELATAHFGIRPGDAVSLHTADAFEFIPASADGAYDVVYMDAFLKPSEATDATGVPLTLKTEEFYRHLARIVSGTGVVVMNVIFHEGTAGDLAVVGRVFPELTFFRVPNRTNVVVVAVRTPRGLSKDALLDRGEALDRFRDAGFSFREIGANVIGGR